METLFHKSLSAIQTGCKLKRWYTPIRYNIKNTEGLRRITPNISSSWILLHQIWGHTCYSIPSVKSKNIRKRKVFGRFDNEPDDHDEHKMSLLKTLLFNYSWSEVVNIFQKSMLVLMERYQNIQSMRTCCLLGSMATDMSECSWCPISTSEVAIWTLWNPGRT